MILETAAAGIPPKRGGALTRFFSRGAATAAARRRARMKVVSAETAKWFPPLNPATFASGNQSWELLCGNCPEVLLTAPDWRIPGVVVQCPSCGRHNVPATE